MFQELALSGKSVFLVACGSFNPPTIMHLRMLEDCRDHLMQLGCRVQGGFLSPVSDAYKKKGLISASHRVSMCQAAVADDSWIRVHTWESTLPVAARTLEVLQVIRKDMETTNAHASAVHTVLCCGADLLLSMRDPKSWDPEDVATILSPQHGVVCIPRDESGAGANVSEDFFWKHLSEQGGDSGPLHNAVLSRQCISVAQQPVKNNISATLIRTMLKEGRSIRHLVPRGVEQYIETHHLYNTHIKSAL